MTPPEDRRTYWNERYQTQGYVFGVEPNVFVAELLADAAPGRVLDMGCGQGRNAVWLAARGHHVTGVDHSDVAVFQAQQLAAEAEVTIRFEVGDLREWEPRPAAYDIVLLSYLQVDEELRRLVHEKAIGAVAPGGIVLLVAHHADNLTEGYGGPDRREVLYTTDDLSGDFGSLVIERNERALRVVDTEDGPRTAIDVVMIARKPADQTRPNRAAGQ